MTSKNMDDKTDHFMQILTPLIEELERNTEKIKEIRGEMNTLFINNKTPDNFNNLCNEMTQMINEMRYKNIHNEKIIEEVNEYLKIQLGENRRFCPHCDKIDTYHTGSMGWSHYRDRYWRC